VAYLRHWRRIKVPTYDYECTKCGRKLSVEQSMHDKPLRRCRKCGGKLEKLLPQSINLIFKGSGFYITDYKKQGAKRSGGDEKAGAGKKKTKKEATSEE
jgi:putative FmdB family regulatory protein